MTRHVCHETHASGWPIRLIQTGFDRFTVEYGRQIKDDLNYGEAASEYGACIMHALACESLLDNRTQQEARKAGDRKPYFPAGA